MSKVNKEKTTYIAHLQYDKINHYYRVHIPREVSEYLKLQKDDLVEITIVKK